MFALSAADEEKVILTTAPAGYEIVSTTTESSSSSLKQTAAVCSGGKRVFGTGARINNGAGEVTLQLTRSDGPRGIGRATAKEDASGYAGSWSLSAFAVCANDLPGFVIASAGTPTNSADTKLASVTCPSGTFVHKTTPTSVNWDVGIFVICGP